MILSLLEYCHGYHHEYIIRIIALAASVKRSRRISHAEAASVF